MLCAPNMPKVVLDSSVLVSAFLTPRGTVVRLLREPARSRYQLCLSEYILTETAETLLSKPRLRTGILSYPDTAVRDYIRSLLMQAEIVADLPPLRVVADDPKDDSIIATAVVAKADYLVTGDRAHLLSLGSYEDIQIFSPREFYQILFLSPRS